MHAVDVRTTDHVASDDVDLRDTMKAIVNDTYGSVDDLVQRS